MRIIAEIGASHAGSLNNLLDLIEYSKDAGADAVKFQCYRAEDLTRPDLYKMDKGLWKGEDLFNLYKKAETPRQWIRTAASHAQLLKIEWGVSVFSESDVGYLAELQPDFFKIASFEIKYRNLIAKAYNKDIPLIISTGMAEEQDLRHTPAGITLLACSSNYPSQCGEILRIKRLKKEYPRAIIGLSDHTPGHVAPVMAVAAGAEVLEKHICLPDRSGPDGGFALTPEEFSDMVEYVQEAEKNLGAGELKISGDRRLMRRPDHSGKWVRGLND
jgi:pseudaminic acid synthase